MLQHSNIKGMINRVTKCHAITYFVSTVRVDTVAYYISACVESISWCSEIWLVSGNGVVFMGRVFSVS